MKKRSYSRGTLLWVDDSHDLTTFRTLNTDFWRRIFGQAENRVYRLLGLQLRVATSQEGGKQALEDLLSEDCTDTFVTAILDLRIPKRTGEEPFVKHGLELAAYLAERQVPFCFLSSKSNAFEELKSYNLEWVPYYRKVTEGETIIPDALARYVLNEFKNNVNWINLEPFFSELSSDSVFPCRGSQQGPHFQARSHFPFFGSFRDFVERWEYRTVASRHSRLVVRAPDAHCDEFIMQSLLVMLAQALRSRSRSGLYYCRLDDEGAFAHVKSRASFKTHRTSDVLVFRAMSAVLTLEQFAEATHIQHDGPVVFVVPNDESAEPYMDLLPRHQTLVFDDLPLIRLGDSASREELVRRSCEFVFRQTRIRLGNQRKPLGKLYLEHPETLTHPLNWVALMESQDISESLSDPFEILEIFYNAAHAIDSLPEKTRDRLIQDMPLPSTDLLRVADERVIQEGDRLGAWRERALDLWLNSSWQFPYGLGDRALRDRGVNDPFREAWEDHCLEVLVELCRDCPETGMAEPALRFDLDQAIKFIGHPATRNLIQGIDGDDFDGLEFLKWPHRRYPMPAALSRLLHQRHRYLWVQSEHLDVATGLPIGDRAFQCLETVVDEIADRVDWAIDAKEGAVHFLPRGWSESLSYLAGLIRHRQVPEAWSTEPDRVWDAMLCLLRNATPISLLFHHLVCGDPLTVGKNSALGRLEHRAGHGTALGVIRGRRMRARSEALLVNEAAIRSWQTVADRVRLGSGFLRQFQQIDLKKWNPLDLVALGQRLVNAFGETEPADGSSTTTLTRFQRFARDFASTEFAMNQDWGDVTQLQLVSGLPETMFKSLLSSQGDLFLSLVDFLSDVRETTRILRYYDGYPFLAAVGELRNMHKETRPQVEVETILQVLQLLTYGMEGLVAQLKFVLLAAGDQEAERIPLRTVHLQTPAELVTVSPDEWDQLIKIQRTPKAFEVFTLGIPGAASSSRFGYHCHKEIHYFEAPAKTRGKSHSDKKQD